MVAPCPTENTAAVDQERFWNGNWDAHKVGWLIAGCAAAVTCGISMLSVLGHARNYNRPLEQRQIIRILLLAPVFAVVSFLSYRFFRAYTYYELAETAYEAFAIAAFLMLLLQYIGDTERDQRSVFASKDKKPLPLPFCCLRFRPSKAYFLVLLKWSVVQYVIIRPAESISGIILESQALYCSTSLSYKYGHVWLLAIDFASISIALYGLIVLYALLKDDLKGRRPLSKFLTIKGVVFITFYQGFIFTLLENYGVIKATQYWTATNISDGLNALCVCLEMVVVAIWQMWAFDWTEYHLDRVEERRQSWRYNKINRRGKTNVFRALLHALNFSDLFVELWHELRFLFDRMRGREYTKRDDRYGLDFVRAFQGESNAENALDGDFKPVGSALADSSRRDGGSETDHGSGDDLALEERGAPSGRLPISLGVAASGSAADASTEEAGSTSSRPLLPSGLDAESRRPQQQQQQQRQQHEQPAHFDHLALPATGELTSRPRSPRSPRDSTGRYPYHIFPGSKTSLAGATAGPGPSASASTVGGFATPPETPTGAHAPAGPSGAVYRVAGFPREATHETVSPARREPGALAQPTSANAPAGAPPGDAAASRPLSWEPQAL